MIIIGCKKTAIKSGRNHRNGWFHPDFFSGDFPWAESRHVKMPASPYFTQKGRWTATYVTAHRRSWYFVTYGAYFPQVSSCSEMFRIVRKIKEFSLLHLPCCSFFFRHILIILSQNLSQIHALDIGYTSRCLQTILCTFMLLLQPRLKSHSFIFRKPGGMPLYRLFLHMGDKYRPQSNYIAHLDESGDKYRPVFHPETLR